MKCQSILVLLVLSMLSIVVSMPPEITSAKTTTTTTTARLSSSSSSSPPPPATTTKKTQIGDTLKQLSNQLMELNRTIDIVTLDTRTPPKIKQIIKNQKHKNQENAETSHAGIAIPLNEDEIHLEEEATKKLNFYKIERPPPTTTTTGGLSTWVFLSGQTTSTIKPPRKAIIKPTNETQSTTLIETNNKMKPIFKKRVTTTRKPFSPKSTRSTTVTPTTITTTTTTPSTITTTPKSKETTKLTKIKASILNNAVNKKNQSSTVISTSTATTPLSSTTIRLENSTNLPIEAKDGDTDLLKADEKKSKRPSTKRKKNKNRRRRPGDKTDTNSTKIEKSKIKPKPIGTQLYNYLSREVAPTVGIGLVGLMAAAGLTYFFYPFGIARRSYQLDRRVDNNNDNYYYDDYSTGIAEEEAIGKVIAGMPENTLFGNIYKQPTSRNSVRYPQQVDHRILQGNNNNPNYNNYNEQFVVGNIPTTIPPTTTTTEQVTPVSVPEHGPRSLKSRRKRSSEMDVKENEIDFESSTITTRRIPSTTTPTTSIDKNRSIFELLADLFRMKIHLSLELLQNATQSVSSYVTRVQKRFDEHYRNSINHN